MKPNKLNLKASMNKLLLIALVATLYVSLIPDSHAQFRWNGSVEVGLTQNQNLFRSPDRLLNDGRTLGAGSLYQNDRVIPVNVLAGIEYRTSSHRIELDYRGSQDRYDRYGNLNGAYHTLRLRETWSPTKEMDFQLSIEGRKSKKIATNALGDELSRLFEYTGGISELEISWDLSKRYSMSVLYAFHYRDYTESANALSLDSHTHQAGVEWTYKSKRIKGRYWQVDIDADYRLKQYRSYLARSADGRQFATNPINKLHLFSTELGLRRALSKQFLIDVEASGRYRYDFFEGYYSYGAAVVEGGFEWEALKDVTLDVSMGARRIHFFEKIAPQEGVLDAPLLKYTYLNGEVSIEYDITPWVTLETYGSTTNRYSNTTEITRLTRRSYETIEAGASLTIDLDRAFR